MESVVSPETTEEVAELMAWATREGVGVLPVGAGGLTRPVTGERRYVTLQTSKLSGITEYEAADLTLTAGAGTPFQTVARALAENSQWAPFDPPMVTEGTLGGLVSEGASGPLQMGYGHLRNHVLGLTVVTGDGRVLRLGGRVVKNVAGFDVLKAVVGSRGSLAVITSVVLRAFPVPPVDRVLVHRGTSVGELLEVALQVGTAPVLPVSSVVVDRLAAADDGPALVVRLHGALATVDADQASLEAHIGARFETPAHVDLDDVRDRAGRGAVMVDASVRPSRLVTALAALDALAPAEMVVDSYIGSVRLVVPATTPNALEETRRRLEDAGGAMRVFAPEMEGRAASLGSTPSPGEKALIERLRHSFDPAEVLWPARS